MEPYQSRNVLELMEACESGAVPKYVFFWGHQPLADGSVGKSCLSQWFEASFTQDDIAYSSAEHFMMAEKAKLFDDMDVFAKIVEARTPGEAKALGRRVRGFDEATWVAKRFEIVTQASYLKFSQNAELKHFLTSTRQRVLVEASPQDRIWGIGLAADDPRAQYPEKWLGENLLGFALMEARERLVSECDG